MIRRTSRAILSLALAGAVTAGLTPMTGSAHQTSTTGRARGASVTPPYAPYALPVNIHVGWYDTQGGVNLPKGQTQENNQVLQYVQKRLNVRFTWDFVAPQANNAYDQKVSLVLASGQMPDVMWTNLQEFHKLANTGQLADLTQVVKQYASPYMKSLFAVASRSMAAATVNGKLLAIPDEQPDYQYDMLWVRQDWLNKVHMAAPKTVDQMIAVAKAFVKAKLGGSGTIGLIGPSGSTSLTSYNAMGRFDTIMQDYGAYQGYYLRKNGRIVYGSVQPEMKTALTALRRMYQAGVIDPQFVSRTSADELAQIVSGKSGMFLGPWWAPTYPLNSQIVNDPKADWREYAAPIGPTGKMEAVGPTPSSAFIVVRKGFAHPEAVMKALNVDQDGNRGRLTDAAGQKAFSIIQQNAALWPNSPLLVQFDYVDIVKRTYDEVEPAVAAHNRSKLAGPNAARNDVWYDAIVGLAKHKDHPNQDAADWASATAFEQGLGQVVHNSGAIHEIYPLTYYPTPTMLQRQATLQSLEQRTMFGIVTGQQPLSQFDSFAREWHVLGGDRILQELKQQVG